MAKRDRFYIEDKIRDLLNSKIKKENYLNMANAKNKEIFLYALSLGIDTPNDLDGKKEGLLLDKDLDMFDESLVYGAAIPFLHNINDVSEKNIIYDFVERCANQGFKYISDSIDNSNIEHLDKQLLLELDEKYHELVEKDN